MRADGAAWPAYDNEAEDMQRFDFTLAELDANSEWFQEAWRILRTLEGGCLGVSCLASHPRSTSTKACAMQAKPCAQGVTLPQAL